MNVSGSARVQLIAQKTDDGLVSHTLPIPAWSALSVVITACACHAPEHSSRAIALSAVAVVSRRERRSRFNGSTNVAPAPLSGGHGPPELKCPAVQPSHCECPLPVKRQRWYAVALG